MYPWNILWKLKHVYFDKYDTRFDFCQCFSCPAIGFGKLPAILQWHHATHDVAQSSRDIHVFGRNSESICKSGFAITRLR